MKMNEHWQKPESVMTCGLLDKAAYLHGRLYILCLRTGLFLEPVQLVDDTCTNLCAEHTCSFLGDC